MKKATFAALVLLVVLVLWFQRSANRLREDAHELSRSRIEQLQQEMKTVDAQMAIHSSRIDALQSTLERYADVADAELLPADRLALITELYRTRIDAVEIPESGAENEAAVLEAHRERSRLAKEMGEALQAVRAEAARQAAGAGATAADAELQTVTAQMQDVIEQIRQRKQALADVEPAAARTQLAQAAAQDAARDDETGLLENREQIAAAGDAVDSVRREDNELTRLNERLRELALRHAALRDAAMQQEAGTMAQVTAPLLQEMQAELEQLQQQQTQTAARAAELSKELDAIN